LCGSSGAEKGGTHYRPRNSFSSGTRLSEAGWVIDTDVVSESAKPRPDPGVILATAYNPVTGERSS
jgi:hypothetical protein